MCGPGSLHYPLIQNDYRQEKIIFELFSGALQDNPVRAPGAITGGALTGQGPIQETIFGEFFSGALQENPVRAPGAITIDTEIKVKWNNMISELITVRITKAKAKVKFGVKYYRKIL